MGGELPDDDYGLCAGEVLPRYELGLRAMGAVDFDDLLLLPLKVLEEYRDRYHYLLVDEYQDTNDAQLRMLEVLAGLRRNLCVVGDDDQSIYAWRGAQLRNILQFDKKFPGARQIFLEQNYRSSSNILDAANAVIGKNLDRKAKRLWTDRGRGHNIRIVAAPDEETEARYVTDEIVRVSYEEKIPAREIAILYRTNAQARPLEEALRLQGVRYRVVGGTSLFDRKEVRDLVAYLRAALNPRDEISLLRIVNVPARGIGDLTVAKAQEEARARKLPIWEIFKSGERTAGFARLLEKYGERLAKPGFSLAARELVNEIGLFDEARRSAQGPAAQARKVEAIESLLRQLIEFEQRVEAGEAKDLSAYLARLALDSKDADGDAGDAVTLMTLHGAKGLEWRCVFLTGLEEGLLPHSGKGYDTEPVEETLNLEEERRLCYVGMTRARERLTLTRAAERIRRGKAIPRTPSRFLEDIPPDLCDVIDLSGPQKQAPKAVQEAKAKSFFSAMDDLLAEPEEA